MAKHVCLAAALLGAAASGASAGPDYAREWQDFKEQYGVSFGTDEDLRFNIFKSNLDTIYEVNARNLSYQLGVNEFSHLTFEEFRETHLRHSKPERVWGDLSHLGTFNYSGAPLADSVDWVAKGAVTQVKNQQQCGSCWSFSTTGSLEGAWQIKTGKLVSLSEQQFVDCDSVDHGCTGGLMDNAFKFAEKNALCTEDSYKYEAKGGTCRASSCTVGIPKGGVTGFKDVAKGSAQAMQEAVGQQPVSVAIEADKPVFQHYKSGVLTSGCGGAMDHGVLVVGYGTEGGNAYWKVKNSWGASWGEAGYIKLKRGKKWAPTGECGLLTEPSFPVVGGSLTINV